MNTTIKNIIKVMLVLSLGLFSVACSPINKGNILEIVSKDTPENFKIKDLEIVDIDKHYDYNNNPATDFNIIYHFESTEDRYVIESVEPDFNDLYINIFFIKKVVSKGEVLVCKLKGRYELNQRYNKYELRVDGLYNFKPAGHTQDVLSTGKKVTKSGDVSSANVIHKEYNNKARKIVKLIEIGSEEEKSYLANRSEFYENASSRITGLLSSSKFILYSPKAGELYTYKKDTNVLKKHSFTVDGKTGELMLTDSPFGRTRYYIINENSTSITLATNKSTKANSTRYLRIRNITRSKDFTKKLKQFIVGTWAYRSLAGKAVLDKYKFETNGDLTYSTIKGSRRIVTYYKWEILDDGFMKITDKITGKESFRFASSIDLDNLTMDLKNTRISKYTRTSPQPLITSDNISFQSAVDYDEMSLFVNGLARVKKSSKYGYINDKDEVVVPLEYDMVTSFRNGVAAVKKSRKYGLINTKGEVVVPLEYDELTYMGRLDLVCVKKSGKWGFLNSKCEVVIPMTLEYDEVSFLSEGLIPVKKFGKWGCINANNEVILAITLEYDSFDPFKDGLAYVKKSGKKGCINTKGEIVVPVEYTELTWFKDGLAVVGKRGKWGYVDTKGDIVMPIVYDSIPSLEKALSKSKNVKYEEVGKYSEGLSKVKRGGKYGYINTKGEIIVPIEYDDVTSFKEGLAYVKKSGKWGRINTRGEIVVP